MRLWIICLMGSGLLLACQSRRAIPVASKPCRVNSCKVGVENAKTNGDLGYHAFIAMVETMQTLDWNLIKVDPQKRVIRAENCRLKYCFDISITTFKNGEVAIHSRGKTKRKYRALKNIDDIVDRFSEVSCFSAGLLENRLEEQGFRFSVQ